MEEQLHGVYDEMRAARALGEARRFSQSASRQTGQSVETDMSRIVQPSCVGRNPRRRPLPSLRGKAPTSGDAAS
eukprot:CAMPEP_0113279070 /NCGR_PEP_ID=MMETSP0008_2-20120614/26965_1 /TAXON_ID=97485 /ORGANISM="Prymnesium parvum" /LENGTH=73 /DNA_ID=CAMNT_0000129183 /DNA_START=9 /DNA_END=227 /DNA_ORIENTATION=- /assembly_acc=CAM_ASM_000153